MRSAECKADVQVSRPGPAFPFGASGGLPPPHLTQCCRFSIPERLPLQPFRQDRLIRLPLPISLMATSKTSSSNNPGATQPKRQGFDSQQKIRQLEKNISFIQDNHATMLKSLHEEIDDLKQKNRELQFEIVTGQPAMPPPSIGTVENTELSPKTQEQIKKLEEEVKTLQNSLKSALKKNNVLNSHLQAMKRENYALTSVPQRQTATSYIRNMQFHQERSPELEEYSHTLRQIQKAAREQTIKNNNDHRNHVPNYWGKGPNNNYIENKRGYYHHHSHRMMQQQACDAGPLPRLPRLPLRNQQQNYAPHQHYNMQYATGHALPCLKQAMDYDNRQKKQKGPQQPKLANSVFNQ